MKAGIFLSAVLFSLNITAQDTYGDSLKQFIDHYITHHEVVRGDDRRFLRFYSPDESYRFTARVTLTPNGKWFSMETSGSIKKTFREYAVLEFTVHDTLVKLPVYQSQDLMTVKKYQSLLFVPFTDLTSGEETYTAGRYIDLYITDIKNNSLEIDFNKAYNPYCAYVTGKFNCPVPPAANQLAVAIPAGEKSFGKPADTH